jgi:hypothetical protein
MRIDESGKEARARRRKKLHLYSLTPSLLADGVKL